MSVKVDTSIIYRYRLLPTDIEPVDDVVTIPLELPKGARVTDAQARQQRLNVVDLWAEVPKDEVETETRIFKVVMTGGGSVTPQDKHISTVQLFLGDIVAHVYEVSGA